MKKVLIGALLAGALMLPATSQAHYGDIWFYSAAQTSRAITDKYPKIVRAACTALGGWQISAFNAHSLLTNDTRRWDHLWCVVTPRDAPPCVVIAHISGARWSDFYLTSYPVRGCSPYNIR